MKNNKIKTILQCFAIFVLLTNFCDKTEAFNTKYRIRRDYGVSSETCAVRSYFKNHLIHSSNTDHCTGIRTKRDHLHHDFMEHFPLVTKAEIIQGHRNTVSVYAIPNPPSPFTEVIVKDVHYKNKTITIPLVLKATIHFENKPVGGVPRYTSEKVKKQMEDMEAIAKSKDDPDAPFDNTGHLLSWNLGGGMLRVWNFVPQINKLTQYSLKNGRSRWVEEENNMVQFLNNNPQGFIDWNVLVVYGEGNIRPLRPLGLCMQYSTTDNDGKQTVQDAKCFSNETEDKCDYDESELCTGLPNID